MGHNVIHYYFYPLLRYPSLLWMVLTLSAAATPGEQGHICNEIAERVIVQCATCYLLSVLRLIRFCDEFKFDLFPERLYGFFVMSRVMLWPIFWYWYLDFSSFL